MKKEKQMYDRYWVNKTEDKGAEWESERKEYRQNSEKRMMNNHREWNRLRWTNQ